MDTFSALLGFHEKGIHRSTVDPHKGPVMQRYYVFFVVSLIKVFNKKSSGRWFGRHVTTRQCLGRVYWMDFWYVYVWVLFMYMCEHKQWLRSWPQRQMNGVRGQSQGHIGCIARPGNGSHFIGNTEAFEVLVKLSVANLSTNDIA